MIADRNWVHEGCGGVFRPHTDGIAVDAGGCYRSRTWTEYYCDRCGMSDAEAYEAECKASVRV